MLFFFCVHIAKQKGKFWLKKGSLANIFPHYESMLEKKLQKLLSAQNNIYHKKYFLSK